MVDPTQIPAQLPSFKEGIDQIGILVEDIERAVETYHRVLGIGPWVFYTYGRPLVKRMSYRGRPGNYRMRIALAQMGRLQIELIQPLEGESIYADFVRTHGYGLHHVAVVVASREEAQALAAAAGLAIIQDGSGYGLDDDGSYTYLDTEDQLGITLELISYPRRRVAPEKIYPIPDAGSSPA